MSWEHANVFLNIATIIFMAGGLVYSVGSLSKRMTALEAEMKALIAVQIAQGRHEERMNAMDQRILAQGKRLDDTMKAHSDGLQSMGRMVEATVSRVNSIADRLPISRDEDGR